MKKVFYTLVLLILICSTSLIVQAMSKSPKKVEVVQPAPKPTPVPTPVPEAPSRPAPVSGGIDKIKAIASGSACSRYSFKERGKAPAAYMKGMAVVYAKSLCSKDRSDVVFSSRANTGKAGDVFNHYGLNPKEGREALRTLYTLMIGLGMRESSGKHCCGRDMSADFAKHDEAETGLFQVSYNSAAASSELNKLYAQYKTNAKGCFLDIFSENVTCSASNWKNWGDGPGVEFQKIQKSCPAFSVEWSAALLRVSGGARGHWGPIRKKEAEMRPECTSMLLEVEKLVDSNPTICSELK